MTLAPTRSALDDTLATVEGELGAWHVPGIEVAVVRDGEALFAGGFGSRGVDDPGAVTATTLFHHGSCGKAYTGLLAALVSEEGLLDLDAPVRRYVPELRLPDPVIAERATMRDLLSHRSGLGRHDHAWIANPSWSRTEALARMAHLPLAGDLRAQSAYSNFGYMLAGIAVERVTGSTWEEQRHSRIFEPLGMTRSGPTQSARHADAEAATPHIVREGVAKRTAYRTISATAPAGDLISCADDSVRWLLAQLGDGPSTMSATAITATHQPTMLMPAGASPVPELDVFAYGFGWVISRFRGRRLIWHNGGVDGFTTWTLLFPDEHIGVLASANIFPTSLPFAVTLQLADALLGETAEDSWYERLRALETTADEGADVPEQATALPAGPAHPLSDYTGTFTDAGYGDLHVAVDSGALAVQVGELAVEARHRRYETWDLRLEALDADFTVTFGTHPDGLVNEASVSFDPGTPTVRYVRRS